ncbi:MAG: hypothetical protein AAGI03_17380, partial [Pseudomonadota bacterium]
MFRLYKRDERGRITHYHEVWVEPKNRRIIVHWGAVGDQGEAEPFRIKLLRPLERQVEDLLKPARDAGFSELERSEERVLVVEFTEDGFGDLGDLDKRDALEERLNEVLGWTGLGWCEDSRLDGAHLEAICFVVDFDRAASVVADGLAGSE